MSLDAFSHFDLDEDMHSSFNAGEMKVYNQFDTVMAADVVYPATTDKILGKLFRTVDLTLKDGGVFLLSFVTRDGYRTPLRLLEAASEAGFKVDIILNSLFVTIDPTLLPPTLDAKMLVLRRDEDAADFNLLLGGESCKVFQGLRKAAEKEDSSDEEWEAPFPGGV